MQRRGWRWTAGVLGLGAALLGLAGCNVKGDDGDSIHPNIRVVNLLPDQATVDVLLNDSEKFSDVGFGTATRYQDNPWATYTVEVNSAAGSQLGSFSLATDQGGHHTVYLYGSGSKLSYSIVGEGSQSVTDGKFVVRTLMAGSQLPGYDLYLTAAGDDIAGLTPTLYAAASGSLTSYSGELAAGDWRVRLTTAGTKTVVYDRTVNFGAKSASTLVLYSSGSAVLPTVMRMRYDDDSAEALPNTLSRLRVVQGTPDVAAARVAVDGATIYQSVPFAGVTNYAIVAAGSRTLGFGDESGGALFTTLDAALAAGRDYSVFLRGTAGAASALLLEDANLPVSSTQVRGRFVNAAADVAGADVVVNYQPLVSALGGGAATALDSLEALAYPLSFSSGGTALAALTTDTLAAGGSYTFALIGAGGQYRAVYYKTN